MLCQFHTIKHSKAVLGCRCQWLAGGVQLVTIVTNADLELDWLAWLLEHARTMEHSAERVLPPPLVFLYTIINGHDVTVLEVVAQIFIPTLPFSLSVKSILSDQLKPPSQVQSTRQTLLSQCQGKVSLSNTSTFKIPNHVSKG